SMLCNPHRKPILDTPAVVDLIHDKARDQGLAKVFLLGAFSQGLKGEQLAELFTLRKSVCMAFSNGLTPFVSNRILRRALEYAATFELTVIFHPQDASLAEGGIAHEGPVATFRGLAGIPETAETVA